MRTYTYYTVYIHMTHYTHTKNTQVKQHTNNIVYVTWRVGSRYVHRDVFEAKEPLKHITCRASNVGIIRISIYMLVCSV